MLVSSRHRTCVGDVRGHAASGLHPDPCGARCCRHGDGDGLIERTVRAGVLDSRPMPADSSAREHCRPRRARPADLRAGDGAGAVSGQAAKGRPVGNTGRIGDDRVGGGVLHAARHDLVAVRAARPEIGRATRHRGVDVVDRLDANCRDEVAVCVGHAVGGANKAATVPWRSWSPPAAVHVNVVRVPGSTHRRRHVSAGRHRPRRCLWCACTW